MGIQVNIVVLAFFFGLIPALVASVVLFLRIESVKGDSVRSINRVDLMQGKFDDIIRDHGTVTSAVTVVESKIQGVDLKIINIEESFTNLTNKWNSRERAERSAAKRKEKEDANILPLAEYEPVIPGTEQMDIPFPPPDAVQQINQPKRRKFGEMP